MSTIKKLETFSLQKIISNYLFKKKNLKDMIVSSKKKEMGDIVISTIIKKNWKTQKGVLANKDNKSALLS